MPFAFSYKSQKKKEAKNNQVQVADKKSKKLFNKKESNSSVKKAEVETKDVPSVQPATDSVPAENNSEQNAEAKPENNNSTSEGL